MKISKPAIFFTILGLMVVIGLLIVIYTLHNELEALRVKNASILAKAKEPPKANTNNNVPKPAEPAKKEEPKVLQKLVEGDLLIEATEDPEDETKQCNSIYFKGKLINKDDYCWHTHSTFSVLHFSSLSSPVIREDWSEFLMRGEGIIGGITLFVVDENGKKNLVNLLTERSVDKCKDEEKECESPEEQWLKGVVQIYENSGFPSIIYKFITYKAEIGNTTLNWSGSSLEPTNPDVIKLADEYSP